jgi:hypothetical protein
MKIVEICNHVIVIGHIISISKIRSKPIKLDIDTKGPKTTYYFNVRLSSRDWATFFSRDESKIENARYVLIDAVQGCSTLSENRCFINGVEVIENSEIFYLKSLST